VNSIEVEPVEVRSVLTRASGYLTTFTHTLNPYMGCAFGEGGCGVYCYVAESPIGLHAGRPWGTWVKAKTNAAAVLERELRSARPPVRIFMSSATDPYQGAESEFRITRALLGVFERYPVDLLVVQTRSPLVEQDLGALARLPFAWLSMTVETDDDAVRKQLTPTCPSIARRLLTMRRAREAGIKVQAAVSPLLPCRPDAFADLLSACADRVVVDTFFGDGANGRRTAHRPLPERFQVCGFGDWRDVAQADELHALLVARMGAERVGWSREGFNQLAAARTYASTYSVS
jgi:DNA repair photolyase